MQYSLDKTNTDFDLYIKSIIDSYAKLTHPIIKLNENRLVYPNAFRIVMPKRGETLDSLTVGSGGGNAGA